METNDETPSTRTSYLLEDDSSVNEIQPPRDKDSKDKERLKSPDRKKKKRKDKEKEKERDREKKEASSLIQKFVEVSFQSLVNLNNDRIFYD
jgi:hypothetical protein